jgi:prolipoprotein diacylglyceryltransferase
MHAHLIFDLLAWAIAIAAGVIVWRWRLKDYDSHAATRLGTGYLIALAAGAIAGAYLIGTLNLYLSGQAAIGRSSAGALLGAIVAIEFFKASNGVRGSTGLYYALPLALGLGIGRLGCFAAGLEDFTYGVPTDAITGVDFGDGINRHPVQLYETASLGIFAVFYLAALFFRWQKTIEVGFYSFIAWYGAERFVWEFFKPYATILGPFNTFHFVSLGFLLYGLFMISRRLSERRSTEMPKA